MASRAAGSRDVTYGEGAPGPGMQPPGSPSFFPGPRSQRIGAGVLPRVEGGGFLEGPAGGGARLPLGLVGPGR